MHKRKRVALFANGWSKECLQEMGYGILERAAEADIDIFSFVNFSILNTTKEEQDGEFNIFLLPDLKDFDGVFLMTNSFNLQRESEYLCEEIAKAKIPAISLEYELEGLDYFGSENYSGMYELTEHMIVKHAVKNIVFVTGIPGHADSETRLRAVQDAAKAHDIELPQENILRGDWSSDTAVSAVKVWIEEHKSLPDVVMCANDIMAIGVCEWFMENGYDVPDDVKVTGYDGIPPGQEQTPVLTSVKRDQVSMGARAMEIMIDKIAGKNTSHKEVFKSHVVCGESCGCHLKADDDPEASSKITFKRYDGMVVDQHFRHMYTALRKVETLEGFYNSISYFFRNNHSMVGNEFLMCIHPRFFVLDDDDTIYKVPGYSEEMDVICSLNGGEPEEFRRMSTREAMFLNSERSEKPGNYIFVSIRNDDRNLGFAMMTGTFDIANEFMLYIWTRHVNQYTEQIQSNVKIAELTKRLRELSVTDVLTGLYNRLGCENVLYPFLDECQKRGGTGVMLFADIDRMKTINDEYGHENGDLALKTVAAVLKTEAPKGFMAGRFGGDEFLLVGETKEDIPIEEIADHLCKQLAKEVKRLKIEFPLKMSVGGIRMERGEAFNLEDCLQKADKSMYSVKAKHHEELDSQKK